MSVPIVASMGCSFEKTLDLQKNRQLRTDERRYHKLSEQMKGDAKWEGKNSAMGREKNLRVLGPLGISALGKISIGQNVTIVSDSRFNRDGINHSTPDSTWGHPQTGSYLGQFEAVFFGTFFASSANRC